MTSLREGFLYNCYYKMHWFCSNLFSEPDILIWGCTGAHWNITKKVSSANLLQPSSKQAIDRDTHKQFLLSFYSMFLFYLFVISPIWTPSWSSPSPIISYCTSRYLPTSFTPPPPSPHLITKTLIFMKDSHNQLIKLYTKCIIFVTCPKQF